NHGKKPFRLFLMRGQSFKSPNWKKKAGNCRGELSQVRVLADFWPTKSYFPRSDTDCKFAGFTPSVVRIHSYPNLSQSHSSSALNRRFKNSHPFTKSIPEENHELASISVVNFDKCVWYRYRRVRYSAARRHPLEALFMVRIHAR